MVTKARHFPALGFFDAVKTDEPGSFYTTPTTSNLLVGLNCQECTDCDSDPDFGSQNCDSGSERQNSGPDWLRAQHSTRYNM
jgi:hypothetical protein